MKVIIVWLGKNIASLRKYILKYFRVKGHGTYNLFSNVKKVYIYIYVYVYTHTEHLPSKIKQGNC